MCRFVRCLGSLLEIWSKGLGLQSHKKAGQVVAVCLRRDVSQEWAQNGWHVYCMHWSWRRPQWCLICREQKYIERYVSWWWSKKRDPANFCWLIPKDWQIYCHEIANSPRFFPVVYHKVSVSGGCIRLRKQSRSSGLQQSCREILHIASPFANRFVGATGELPALFVRWRRSKYVMTMKTFSKSLSTRSMTKAPQLHDLSIFEIDELRYLCQPIW